MGLGEGKGGLNQENSIDISTLACVKQIVSGKLLYSTRNSACFSVMTGRDGVQGRGKVEERLKREGIYVYLELIHVVV